MSKGDEKRIYQRSPIELAASYGIPEDDVSESATVINISQGGFCISSPHEIKPGKKLTLDVELESSEHVTVNVESVWAKRVGDTGNYQIGVRVTNSEGDEFDKFLDFYTAQVKEISEEL